MTLNKIKLLALGVVLCISAKLSAQNSNNSPYSISGVGILSQKGFMHQRMMGDLNTALDSSGTFSFVNPASLSNTTLTNMEFGASFSNIRQESGSARNDYNTGKFDYLGLGIPLSLKRKIGFGFGLAEFSNVDYFIINQGIEDSLNTSTAFEGTGGLYQFQLAIGFQVYKGWSAGWTMSPIFGNVQSNIDKNYETNPNKFSYRIRSIDYYSGVSQRAGVQYNGRIKNSIHHSFGATFGFESKLDVSTDRIIRTYNSAGNFFVDTVLNRSDEPRKLTLPSGYSIGYTIGDLRHWSLGVQYSVDAWGGFTDLIGQNNYFDQKKMSIGGFFQAKSYTQYESYASKRERSQNYLKVVRFYYGVSYSSLYMNSFSEEISELGINFGLGLPIIRSTYIDEKKKIGVISRVNVGVGYNQRGNNDNGMIKENIFHIRIGTNFNDKWFTKRKYQ
jgi:hypothetical protein